MISDRNFYWIGPPRQWNLRSVRASEESLILWGSDQAIEGRLTWFYYWLSYSDWVREVILWVSESLTTSVIQWDSSVSERERERGVHQETSWIAHQRFWSAALFKPLLFSQPHFFSPHKRFKSFARTCKRLQDHVKAEILWLLKLDNL